MERENCARRYKEEDILNAKEAFVQMEALYLQAALGVKIIEREERKKRESKSLYEKIKTWRPRDIFFSQRLLEAKMKEARLEMYYEELKVNFLYHETSGYLEN